MEISIFSLDRLFNNSSIIAARMSKIDEMKKDLRINKKIERK